MIASLGLCLASLKFAAACPGSNSCLITDNATEYFDENDHAMFTIHVEWHTVGIPAIGYTNEASGTSGVINVDYTPDYFFPDNCEDDRDITVECDLDGTECSTSVLNTRLTTGGAPNYCTIVEPTTIDCP
jgi:hypothetical protein